MAVEVTNNDLFQTLRRRASLQISNTSMTRDKLFEYLSSIWKLEGISEELAKELHQKLLRSQKGAFSSQVYGKC